MSEDPIGKIIAASRDMWRSTAVLPTELQVDSVDVFTKSLRPHLPVGVGDITTRFLGFDVVEKPYLPKNTAVLVDHASNVMKIFHL